MKTTELIAEIQNDITYSNMLEACKFVHNVTRCTYEYQK